MGDDFEPILCRSYTYARRYPLVIGKIAGWAPIWGPATPTQYGVGLGSIVALLLTRKFWAHLPGPTDGIVIVVVPFALAWMVRAARIEDRPPLRFLMGLMTLLTTPAKGVRQGKPVVEPRTTLLRGGWIFVSSLPPRTEPTKGVT
jgi:hypothetical protein